MESARCWTWTAASGDSHRRIALPQFSTGSLPWGEKTGYYGKGASSKRDVGAHTIDSRKGAVFFFSGLHSFAQ